MFISRSVDVNEKKIKDRNVEIFASRYFRQIAWLSWVESECKFTLYPGDLADIS